MLILSLLLFAFIVAFVVALTWGMWQRDQLLEAIEAADIMAQRAINAERQLPAFHNWPDLLDPGDTQTIRLFDEWAPRHRQ